MKLAGSYIKNAIFFIIIMAVITACAPDSAKLPENVEKGEKSITAGSVNSPAVVVFYIGNCYRLNNNDWELLSIGQFLFEQDVIKVDADSYLEIQIGNRALICIEENTEIIMESLIYELGNKEIKLYLKEGSVFSSLKKLLHNETFEIETPKIILSIRGTQFLVKESEEDTLVAVKEGSVMLLPPGIDKSRDPSLNMDPRDPSLNMDPRDPAVENQYKDMIEQVTASLQKEFPVLQKEKEIIITRNLALQLGQEIETIFSHIEKNIEEKTGITEDQLMRQIKDISKSLHDLKNQITDWQDKTKKEIQGNRQASMINLLEDKSGMIMDFSQYDITIIEIITDSDKAFVYMDNTLMGKKRIGAFYDPENQFHFVVTCPGYEDTVFDVNTKPGVHHSYNVRLLKEDERFNEKPVYMEDEERVGYIEKGETEPGKEDFLKDTVVTIKTDPRDSVIHINGEFTGYGTYTGNFKKGDELSVLCMREGYFDATFYIKIEEWGVKENYTITLISKADDEPRFSVSNTEIIGQIEYKNGILYIADRHGSLFAVDILGKVKWTVSTDNNPNEHSFPVLIRNRLYFSGPDELIILDASSGALLSRKALNPEEAHYFGRRIIQYKEQGLYPANNTLKIMDMETADFIKDIPCPGGSRMTPVIYKNRIYIVNQEGSLLKINPETGFIEKKITTQAVKPIALPMTIKNDFLYFADSKGHIVCIDGEKEQVNWERDISGVKAAVYLRLEAGEKSINIFVRETLYSMALDDGEERFPRITNVTCPPLYKNGMLIYGTTDGFLTFLNEEDGTVVSKINVEQKITTRPVSMGDKLLIGTETGNIFIITVF